MANHPLRIVFATSEFAPFIKTGGLADVAGALPAALTRLGAEVWVLLPAYPQVLSAAGTTREIARIPPCAELPEAGLRLGEAAGGVHLLLLDCPRLYGRPGNPYLGPDGRDWPDNDLRYGLLSRAAALLARGECGLEEPIDILHCNDWQTGLAPVYLRHGFAGEVGPPAGSAAKTAPAATLITLHNLAYQGLFEARRLAALGLPERSFTIAGVEFYGRISFLKGAIACADAISTVSPTYAREICGESLGFGLHGLLAQRADVLTGILNGIDTQEWDPAADPHLPYRYDIHRLANKAFDKRALQAELALPARGDVPLLGVVSRLVHQKGIDLVLSIAPRLLEFPVQLVVQGTGERAIEERLRALSREHPASVQVRIAFDEGLAHRIEAGADLFLMPSRFEPCGLNQMYSQRYGTPPVVCATGGLADSVVDCTPTSLAARTATGFVFYPAIEGALLGAIRRAVTLYRDPPAWQSLQRNAMNRDFSWEASARRYLEVYREAITARASTPFRGGA